MVAVLTALKKVKSLPFQVFDARRIGEAQQMHGPKDGFGVSMGIGRVDIAFDRIIMQQTIDDGGALPFGGTDHGGAEEQMTLVNKAVDANAFILTKDGSVRGWGGVLKGF